MKVDQILNEVVDVEGASIEDLQQRMEVARRALGYANKLTGPSKKKHMSQVMTNLNKIGHALRKLIMQQEDEMSM